MNTSDDNTPQDHTPDENTSAQNPDENDVDEAPAGESPRGDRRPLGYWLRTVDQLLTQEFAAAFASEGVSRRDWMLLNVLTGDVDAPGFAERIARKGKRLRRLEDLGWAEEQGDGTWALTDAGRAAHERLGEVVSGIRSRVAGAVTPEEFATTMASLEAIARELGWDETSPFPRGRGFGPWGRFGGPRPFRPDIRFGFGPNLHHGFEPGRPGRPGTDPHHGTSHGDAWAGRGHDGDGCHGHRGIDAHRLHGEHGHGHGAEHGHGGHRHGAEHGHEHGQRGHRGRPDGSRGERAFERGFAAGYAAAERRNGSAA